MIIYKCDILQKLRDAGYTSYRMRKERILGEAAIQAIREGKIVSYGCINKICNLLHCDISDLIKYVPD